MDVILSLQPDLWLKIDSSHAGGGWYPTARLQKGWRLIQAGEELTEEAVGFGVPVLKRGLTTLFPGEAELTTLGDGPLRVVTANFKLNLEERLARAGHLSVRGRWFYAAKNLLAALLRRSPAFRYPLTALSNAMRWLFGWETHYEISAFAICVKVIYSLDSPAGVIRAEVDTAGLAEQGVTEVVIMHEQGARLFDRYRDSQGLSLSGEAIGCWDEVAAEEASFVSETHRLAFSLRPVRGARLFRGRELIGSRLAWAGFGYSFSPTGKKFGCEIKITRLA